MIQKGVSDSFFPPPRLDENVLHLRALLHRRALCSLASQDHIKTLAKAIISAVGFFPPPNRR